MFIEKNTQVKKCNRVFGRVVGLRDGLLQMLTSNYDQLSILRFVARTSTTTTRKYEIFAERMCFYAENPLLTKSEEYFFTCK